MALDRRRHACLALVTGASSGIGRAFARRLGSDGYDLVVVGRRRERLDELVAALPDVAVRSLVADLGTDAGIEAVAAACSGENVPMLVNNDGVAHHMPFVDLPPDKASEILHVEVVAPTMLARAAVRGMVGRGEGVIINVSGMLAFSGTASLERLPLRRAVCAATLAHVVTLSQSLHEEPKPRGARVRAFCPGVVATEFHERQGLDLSAVPRMSAEDVVTASPRGLDLGEVVCAPGVEDVALLRGASDAGIAAFDAQAPRLAERYRREASRWDGAITVPCVGQPPGPSCATSEATRRGAWRSGCAVPPAPGGRPSRVQERPSIDRARRTAHRRLTPAAGADGRCLARPWLRTHPAAQGAPGEHAREG